MRAQGRSRRWARASRIWRRAIASCSRGRPRAARARVAGAALRGNASGRRPPRAGCCARIAGASEIRAIDLDPRKLEQATRFGATHVEPGAVDFVFDVVARRSTVEQGLGLLGSGGTFVLIGLSPGGETVELDLPRLFAKK